MSFSVNHLATQKEAETQHTMLDWAKCLESARQGLKFIEIDYQSLEYFALASRSPAQFTVLVRLIYQYGRSHLHGDLIADLILEYVDESPFSLSDWLDAIEFFYRWLQGNQRKIDFLAMLKYLSCCVESRDAQESGQTFAELIKDMLHTFDYEG
jgi:hypothetical protein